MDFEQAMNLQDELMESAKISTASAYQRDERFWMATRDGQGNGGAIIRFLPQQDTNKPTDILRRKHTFKVDGKTFFAFCIWRPGKSDCPICEEIMPLWDKEDDESKKLRSERGAKKEFISNILVINDPQNPENNGKVFLFKFGTKIREKIDAKLSPAIVFGDEEDDVPVNPFNMKKGCDFRLIITKGDGGWANYSQSSFSKKITPVADTPEKMKEIWENLYSLDEFTDEKMFMEYEEMKEKYYKILGRKYIKSEEAKEVKKEVKKETKKIKEQDISSDQEDMSSDDFNFSDPDETESHNETETQESDSKFDLDMLGDINF